MMTSLTDIPREVISTCLLPLLSINEVLRTRRICKWIKNLSEDHLRRQCSRSKCWVKLFVADEEHEEDYLGRDDLLSFLRKEQELATSAAEAEVDDPIPKPFSQLIIEVESINGFDSARLRQFLARYGSQVRKLEVVRGLDPYTQKELWFYEQFPNLEYFEVVPKPSDFFWFAQNLLYGRVPFTVTSPVHFPEVFENLVGLSVGWEFYDFSVWPMIATCNNLRTFKFRMAHGNAQLIKKFLKAFGQNHHKNLKYLELADCDIRRLNLELENYRSLVSQLYALIKKCDIKLLNVTPWFFVGMEEMQGRQFAPNILSLRNVNLCDPNLPEMLRAEVFPETTTVMLHLSLWPLEQQAEPIITWNLELLSTKKFPSLRILKVDSPIIKWDCDAGKSLAGLWNKVPCLEEVEFKADYFLQDIVFIGENGELPFLQLTKLKRLDLGSVSREFNLQIRNSLKERTVIPLSDVSFVQVFSKMRLREFSLCSEQPLIYVTSQGIRALLGGPFAETIERFSFHRWALEGMGSEEFQLLSKEFKCNRF